MNVLLSQLSLLVAFFLALVACSTVEIKAQFPGKISKLYVKAGDKVFSSGKLFAIESMKMNVSVMFDSTEHLGFSKTDELHVLEVPVQEDAIVEKGTTIVILEKSQQ
jgi:acetyl/propionyl-CoA carboxylase alpha subunit